MFIKNVIAISLAAIVAVSVFAKGSSHVDDSDAAIRAIGNPCTIRINDSVWINAKAVSFTTINEWRGEYQVQWFFGKGFTYIKTLNYQDSVNWIKWYNQEVINTCK